MKTFNEMLDYARKNPGKLSYGSAGLGTSTHMRLEMLKLRANIDILHVPYRGSANSLNDLLAGNIQMMNEINPLPHVKAGKLFLLNINSPKRSPDWPGVPTLTELGYPDSDVPGWFSICAPVGTPADIVQTLNAKVVEIAKTEAMTEDHARHQRGGAAADAGRDQDVSRRRHQAQRGSDQDRQGRARIAGGGCCLSRVTAAPFREGSASPEISGCAAASKLLADEPMRLELGLALLIDSAGGALGRARLTALRRASR